jgi:hypothetical protein
MRRSWLALCLITGLAHAKPATPTPARVHLELAEVHAVPQAPAELSVKGRDLFNELVAARPTLVAKLDGAPDPLRAPDDYRRYLDAHGVRAYAVELKVDEYARALKADDRPGKSGQLLTVSVGVSLVASQLPGRALALAGKGGASVEAEVGATVRPGEEQGAAEDALRAALAQAIDDAVGKLERAAPARGKRKK